MGTGDRSSASLNVEPEVHDIAVLHDIPLSFDTKFAGLFYGCFRAVLDEVVVVDDFSPDKPFFEVGMDDAGSLGGGKPGFDAIRTCFLHPHLKIRRYV